MNKSCFRLPIPEIFQAAQYLQSALESHLMENYEKAQELIIAADMSEIWEWVESIIGKKSLYIEYFWNVSNMPTLEKSMRVPLRMPNSWDKKRLHDHYGYCCQFCWTPVIRSEVRDRIRKKYPTAHRWWKTNASRHNAFFALWAQYDHIIPHARGGTNDPENMILTCSACNFWRVSYLLEEVWISLPSEIKKWPIGWNWLENFI